MSFDPCESSQAVAALNFELNNIETFSKKHCLKLNSTKTVAIIFGRKNDRLKFSGTYGKELNVSSNQIEFKNAVKNLGLYIDQDLRFTPHINKILQSAYMSLRLIFQNRRILNKNIKSRLCDVLVLSKCNYCDVVYGPCITEKDSKRLQKLQNSCLRLVYGIRRSQRISDKLRENDWLNMKERRQLHAVCQYFGIICKRAPKYLYNKIRFRTDIHNINIRQKGKLTIPIPTHSTQLFKRSFSYNIAHYINELSFDYTKVSKAQFKKRIIRSLF